MTNQDTPKDAGKRRRPGKPGPSSALPAIAVLAVLLAAGLYAVINDNACPL